MENFGTKEYGNKEGFTLKCNKCGKKGRIVPITYYDKDYIHPTEIVIDLRCECGNKFGATIYNISL